MSHNNDAGYEPEKQSHATALELSKSDMELLASYLDTLIEMDFLLQSKLKHKDIENTVK